MNKYVIIATILFLQMICQAQFVDLDILGPLPDEINEASGIEILPDGSLLVNNDSGDAPQLYRINVLGELQNLVFINDTIAIDYEELAKDNSGHLYIGDFGNNSMTRTNLVVYKSIELLDQIVDTIHVERINFQYVEQSEFPPANGEQNFDCEAMFHDGNRLLLFTKNHSDTTFTYVYSLPDTAGNYSVVRIDSIVSNGLVTSASISEDGSRVAILGESFLMVFWNYQTLGFGSNYIRIEFTRTQKEGVCFKNNHLVYIVDEEELEGTVAYLYSCNLDTLMSVPNELKEEFTVIIFPNPVLGMLHFSSDKKIYRTEIYDAMGCLKTETMNYDNTIDVSGLERGIYYIYFFCDKELAVQKTILVL